MSKSEAVRAIDIPVPSPMAGGIFDHARVPDHRDEHQNPAIKRLRATLFDHYGTVFPAWIERLMAVDRRGVLLRSRDRFVARFCLSNHPWEVRFAEKFGVMAAAGVLATRTRLLPWPEGWASYVAGHAYERARASLVSADQEVPDLVRVILRALDDPHVILPPITGRLDRFGPRTMGLHWTCHGEQVLALRDDVLTRLAVTAAARTAFDDYASRHELVVGGHRDRRTTQIRHPVLIDGRRLEKPRFLLIKTEALRRVSSLT